MDDLLDMFTATGLKTLCGNRQLDITGNKNELAKRLIEDGFRMETKRESTPESEGLADAAQSTRIGENRGRSFKHVMGSFEIFRGDDNQDVTEWLNEFDRIGSNNGWDALDWVTNLKKSLGTEPQMAVRKIHDYAEAKEALIEMYRGNTDPARLMELMMERKVRPEETTRAYVLEMRRWGETAGLSKKVIIKRIAAGLNTDTAMECALMVHQDYIDLIDAIDHI